MNIPYNSDYTIVSNNEAASIICKFTPTMIEDIVREALDHKFRNDSLTYYNLIQSMETDYRMNMSGIPEYSKDIIHDRNENYLNIINMICEAHSLQYIYDESHDMYSTAFIIYDLLISNFNIHLINFFINYIYKNKDIINET